MSTAVPGERRGAGDGPAGGPPAERRTSDRRAADQRRLLQRVADALAWPLEPRAVAAQLVEAACTALGAPRGWCAVRSDDGKEAVILAQRGYRDGVLEPWLRVPMDAEIPMTEVIRTGRTVSHASARERLRDYPTLADRAGAGAPGASAVVPMVFEGGTIGALAVVFDEARGQDAADRWFLEALAAYGAGALERARLFEAVGERDARLKLALEASGIWVWSWDAGADRVTWTPEPPSPESSAADGTPLRDWLATMHPDDRGAVADAVAACLRGTASRELEFRVRQPDGRVLWLLGTCRALEPAEGSPPTVIGTVRDITERKEADLERARRLEAEREAARLRDAFISVVSHELRTPITTIFGGTRVLSRRWREMEPAARDALLGDVSGEADRLYRMVEDLLVITRVERGSLEAGDEPVALRPVVERAVASERSRSPGVAFEARLPPDLPLAQGDEMYVEQVLRNLLANAAKYGGPGSRVSVVAAADRDAVRLSVLDEGPGIDEAEAERLFELFYRSPATAPTVSGAGIGLFVCRQLAIAMGGVIRARNRPAGGAEMELLLRRHDEDAES